MDTKILLSEDQIPRQWYNIIPDMPGPLAPVISPRTLQPVTPEEMMAIFPMSLIEQEIGEIERFGEDGQIAAILLGLIVQKSH